LLPPLFFVIVERRDAPWKRCVKPVKKDINLKKVKKEGVRLLTVILARGGLVGLGRIIRNGAISCKSR